MQTVYGDNLYEMSKTIFFKNKKNIINLSSAELAQRVVKVINTMNIGWSKNSWNQICTLICLNQIWFNLLQEQNLLNRSN